VSTQLEAGRLCLNQHTDSWGRSQARLESCEQKGSHRMGVQYMLIRASFCVTALAVSWSRLCHHARGASREQSPSDPQDAAHFSLAGD